MYEERLEQRRRSWKEADDQAARFGNLRLLIVVAALLAGWYGQWWVVGGCALLFVVVGIRLQAIADRLERFKRAIAYYEQALDRIQGNWAGRGKTGEAHVPAEHLFANDLDLFGRASLFELLCQARTRLGESTLAGWLLAPADLRTIAARQEAVRELSPKLDLREDLAVIGAGNPRQLRATLLADWGEAAFTKLAEASRPLYRFLGLLGATGALALIADVLGAELPYLRIYYLSIAIVSGSIVWRYRYEIHHVLEGAEGAAHEVALLSAVLARIEAEQFQCARLVALRAQLDVDGLPPSKRIAQLRRWMELADSRDHFLVRLLGPLVLYDLHLAFALEDWRKQSGTAMRRWLDSVGEIEALSSLANYQYENPTDVFPEFTTDGPTFIATELTHPLMPRAQAVANDIALGQPTRVFVVSGSNMSGKSTLMRTVGINAVLAQAGAPVRARSLKISPLALGASISTHDSLQGNTSRFYAEILRLRDIMQKAAGDTPVLFLIDEVLSGTNSHDRRIGAAAILKGLVERGSVGFTSTHDLALTHIVEDLGPRAANVHFEDQLIDGTMRFDYKMQPGVVTHSNAIALMRAVGIEV
jgi:hypothetical protein